jgi:hypothetical protein
MDLMTTAQIRSAVKAIPRTEWDALSTDSGVPRSTIEKIAYGVTSNPGYDATVALAGALKRRSERPPAPSDAKAA